jgi:DNA polymerase-3 subunit alpha
MNNEEETFVEVNDDAEMEGNEILETTVLAKVEEVEEIKVITKLTMPKIKIKISNELLMELEKKNASKF